MSKNLTKRKDGSYVLKHKTAKAKNNGNDCLKLSLAEANLTDKSDIPEISPPV